jgi:RND family efflux transporter MFP subunit
MNKLMRMCSLAVGMWAAWPTLAHEGHAALPSKGVTVAGERIYLSPGAVKAINLQTAKVSLQDISRWIRAGATVELAPNQRAKISTLISGRIDAILVKPGESVQAGQSILRIRSPELEAIQLEYVQAFEAHHLAEQLLSVREALVKSGATPAKLIVETQTEHQQTHARLELAAQKLQSLGVSQEEIDTLATSKHLDPTISLDCPIDGTVAHVDVRLGQSVAPEEHLAEVVNLAEAFAEAQVLESDASFVRAGMTATATFASHPSQPIKGVVESIGVAMDPAKRILPVRIRLDNQAGWLRPGMFGRLAIQVAEWKDAVVAPRTTIVRRGGKTFVLLEESDRKYLRKPVRLGASSGDVVEILEGAFPGHRLVTTGAHELEALLGNPPEPVMGSASAPLDKENATAESVDGEFTLEAKIELPTDQRAIATSLIAGRIASIQVKRNQQVKRGDILFEIESVESRDTQLSLLQTNLQLAWAKRSRDRLQSLEGVESTQNLWRMESEVAQLSSQINQQSSKLQYLGFPDEIIQALLGHDIDSENQIPVQRTLPVRAMIDGWVTELNVVLGESLRPDQPLAEIQNSSRVWVRGFAFENQAGSLAVGQEASIQFPSSPAVIATGRVERISSAATGSARALSVWVPVDNSEFQLKPGMSVLLSILARPTATPLAADKE